MKIDRGATQNPAAQLVSQYENGGHCQGVGNPDQNHRQGQITADQQGEQGRDNGLPGDGDESRKYSNKKRQRDRVAVEVKQVWVFDKRPQPF